MSSVQALRDFINERLTAAAGEIFTVFEQTIVQYEEEIDRQRKLLQIIWKPQIKLHRTEPPKQHACAEEQHFPQQEDSSGQPEEVDPPQIKEEEEELCAGEAGDQLQLGLEGGSFMMAFTDEQSYFDQPESDFGQPRSPDPAAAGGCDPKDGENVECGLDAALEAGGGCYGESVDDSSPWQKQSGSQTSKPSYETCSQTFSRRRPLLHHQRRRAGERKHSCKICRESFGTHSDLFVHMRSHTDERPYSCEMCGKRFGVHRNLLVHMRTHTGEKPYSCAMCGRSFSKHSNLLRHIRTHTGEKPFPCSLCDKSFRQQSHLLRHRRTHRE